MFLISSVISDEEFSHQGILTLDRNVAAIVAGNRQRLTTCIVSKVQGGSVVSHQAQLAAVKYLTWLLKQAKDADLTDDQVTQSLLPWNVSTEFHTK